MRGIDVVLLLGREPVAGLAGRVRTGGPAGDGRLVFIAGRQRHPHHGAAYLVIASARSRGITVAVTSSNTASSP